MFGGNPGGKNGKKGRVRLGYFWRLVLVRPSEAALERRCRFTIREGRFAELARRSPMDALGYLQTDIADIASTTASRTRSSGSSFWPAR